MYWLRVRAGWGTRLSKVLALANQKGGVGKTTTSVNVACQLAVDGAHVLLLDFDPQGNATNSLGVDKRAVPATIYDALLDDVDIADVVLRAVRPRLDLIPANEDLAGAEGELPQLTRYYERLRDTIAPLRTRYDVIVVDCPPSLGVLTINALVAADAVVVPVQCEYLALEGLSQFVKTVDLLKRQANRNLDILGILMTMYDARTRLALDVVRDVQRMYPNRIFRTIIPRSVRLAEAPSYGRSIFEHDPSSRVAEAYRNLSQEIISRLGINLAGSTAGSDRAPDAVAGGAAAFSSD